MSEDPISYITWHESRQVTAPDLPALARWAQGAGRTTVEAWQVDDQKRRVRPVELFADRDMWYLRNPAGSILATTPADPLHDRRALAVVDYVERHMSEPGGFHCVRWPGDRWPRQDGRDPLGLYCPYGYVPPVDVGGEWEWEYCPELIAGLAQHLDDRAFELYLTAIETRVTMHRTHSGQHTAEELEVLIDRACYDISPDTAAIVNEVQMRALDQRIG